MPRTSANDIREAEDVSRRRGGRPARLSRARILDVARQIPARELTMPIVARRLDVSTAALYRHFESRDALLAALGGQLAQAFVIRTADPSNWRDWLSDTAEALYHFMLDNPAVLAVPDWTYVDSMGKRLLDAAYATLEGAGFDTVTSIEIWGVVAGHAYLGARLLHDAPAQNPSPAPTDTADPNLQRWLALAKARGTTDQRQLLVHSLRWLVSVLPAPPKRKARRKHAR